MTVLAWDGKTLAADRRTVAGGLPVSVTKIRRVGECLIGITGGLSTGMALFDWYEHGADPDDYPAKAADEDGGASLIVITKDKKILVYEDAYAFEVEESYYAAGSGRSYALTAMHLGKSAAEAVEIASIFDTGCGNGVDILEHSERGSAKRG